MNLSFNPTHSNDQWVDLDFHSLAVMQGDHIIAGSEEDASFVKAQLLFKNIQGVVVHEADTITLQVSKANIVYFTQRPRQLAISMINGNTTVAYSVEM